MKKQYLPLLLILLVATGLRFYHFSDLPFTFDEFSTVFRLHYDNICDVINIGMKELDNHPIGTQVFYYYYTHLFGESEQMVKLPIIIFGIVSVFMVWLLGKRWFNTTAGVFAASFMAVLQYCVAQSEIARMYGFGIPFVLLMVYYWDKLLHDKFSLKHALFFILFASICSYTHYFSLMFAAIVGLTVIFLIPKVNLKKYILTCFVIFLLFVPHLNIFFYQLSKGGIEGWLGQFRFSYFFSYLAIVFNHSWFVALILIAPIVLFFNKRLNKKEKSYRSISIIWFLIPMFIGFTYSYLVNNVVHERVLYFSFPFLLLFLASFIKSIDLKKELIMVLVILIIGSASLFIERKHYFLFENQRNRAIAEQLIKWEKELGTNDVLSVKFTHEKIDRYYNLKNNFADSSTIYISKDYGIGNFISLLQNNTYEYLYFGRADIIDQTYLQVALKYYPEMVRKFYTYAGEAYLLKKGNRDFKWPCIVFESEKNFEHENFVTNDEYIGSEEFLLDTIIFSHNNLIELSVEIMQFDSIGGALLVSSMEKNGEVVDWRAGNIDEFIQSDSVYTKAMFTVFLPDIRFEKNTKVKFFIWNKNKGTYGVKNINILTRAGNPYIYGGVEKIPFNKQAYCISGL